MIISRSIVFSTERVVMNGALIEGRREYLSKIIVEELRKVAVLTAHIHESYWVTKKHLSANVKALRSSLPLPATSSGSSGLYMLLSITSKASTSSS